MRISTDPVPPLRQQDTAVLPGLECLLAQAEGGPTHAAPCGRPVRVPEALGGPSSPVTQRPRDRQSPAHSQGPTPL